MKYRLTVETLSPLHIGSGDELLKDYDYVTAGGSTYILDQAAIYAHEFDRRGDEARLLVPAGRLEIPGELSPASPYVRYTLQGEAALERLHAFIKDIHDRPYLPGSSFKGAVRTALLEHALSAGRLDLDPARLGNDARQAAQGWERGALGRNATEDLLRAVQVSDSQPAPETEPPVLQVTPAWVFAGSLPHGNAPAGKDTGAPIEVEAVRQGVVFNLELNLDELTLGYAKELGWDDRAGWLAGLVQILQAAGRAHLQDELHYAQAQGFSDTEHFYHRLLALVDRLEGASGVVLQLGWGSGWTGLTVGPRLPLALQKEIRRKYKLGRPLNARRDWQPDLERSYPKSRRLASASGSKPGLPFGWVLVGFAEQGRPSALWENLQTAWLKEDTALKARPAESPKVKPPAAPPPPPARATPGLTSSTPSTGGPVSHQPSPPSGKAPPAPTPPVKTPPPEKTPPPRQVLSSFTIPPAVGAWIEATVFEVTASVLRLEMDGLDPDTEAYIEVALGTEVSLRRFREGDTVECQVVRKEKEGRVTRVIGNL